MYCCTHALRVLKLSSRNLNYLIIAGAVLLYICAYLYIFSERDLEKVAHDALCNVRSRLYQIVLICALHSKYKEVHGI